jgi:hypothetical protein
MKKPRLKIPHSYEVSLTPSTDRLLLSLSRQLLVAPSNLVSLSISYLLFNNIEAIQDDLISKEILKREIDQLVRNIKKDGGKDINNFKI